MQFSLFYFEMLEWKSTLISEFDIDLFIGLLGSKNLALFNFFKGLLLIGENS